MSDHVIVCAHCHSINRVEQNELINHPTCVDCAELLLSKSPIEADEALFNRFIINSTLPVIVNFWGAWSGKSLEMAEIFTSLADTFKQDAVFLRVNSQQEQVLANSYKLIDFPTFILFQSGAEYRRLQGAVSERDFHLWLERYLRVKRKKLIPHPSSV
jgi:thioredoxin 2